MGAHRTLRRQLKADKDRRMERSPGLKPGARFRRCSAPHPTLLRMYGVLHYLHPTKGWRTRRLP